MSQDTALDRAYEWEKEHPDRLWMTQPIGGGEVKTYTWKQALDESRRMATHLKSLGLPEKSHIALFSKNCAWWILADLAIWMAGHVSVPLYPTLTPETVRQILEHSEAKLILIGKLDGFEGMEPGIPADMPRIAMPLSPPTNAPKWEDLVAENEPLQESPTRDPEEMGTIIYTSGSTGVPKGVMHSFGHMAAAAQGIIDLIGIQSDDRMLSYLPLAHSFERWVVEHCSLMVGFQLFFAETLDTFVHDLRRAKPTLFISVPRLWQKFQSGVFQKMPPSRLDLLLKIPLVNGFIRNKVLSGLGLEHVRFAGSGSAPIPAELIAWYRKLGLELLEGYGMTENFSYSHVNRPGNVRVGYVGEAYPGVEVRISDEGEIQIKSPGDMMGYYKMPEETKAAFTEDGFLKTGDRGEIDEQGRLKITGRTKELFKTSKGKYVAPAPIENKVLLHEQIEMACVGGNGMPQPYCLVMLSDDARAKATDPAVREAIAASLATYLNEVNATLDHHETMQFVAVTTDEWTVENGMLTPTLKLKRRSVDERYGESVPKWYDEKKKVIWT